MQDRDEPITATKLYEKKSKNGNIYFTGRLGGLKVLIFKSRDTSDSGEPIWEMKFAQAQPYQVKKVDDLPTEIPFTRDDYEGPDVSNEGPASPARQEFAERADRARRGFDDEEIPF